jgi:aconitate hydratase
MAPSPTKSNLRTLAVAGKNYRYAALEGVGDTSRLPFSIRVLLEALLRHVDGFIVTDQDVQDLVKWKAKKPVQRELPFMPGRVVLQDFTGVPCVVDLAAMRDAMKKLGGDPNLINPLVKCDLVIDHSVQVDAFGSNRALQINSDREFERNGERYRFLKWGQQSLANFSCVPPATGIVHQVNLEYLAGVVLTKQVNGETIVYPDSCVGTDSHTTMINGLGVVGWGVGGIEAEAVMLGQPVYMLTPEVVGFKLVGRLPEGATATDLVLTVTQILRKKGVVDKFVEFFGEGISALSIPDRATISNMAPEYGATVGFFPVDKATLDFLRFTGRSAESVALVEAYYRAQGMFWEPGKADPEFTDVIELDLGTVQPSLAGPKRPQDRVLLKDTKAEFAKSLAAPLGNTGFGLAWDKIVGSFGTVKHQDGSSSRLSHGAVVIAAITSCTNTSNPDVMLAAGLLARKARARGLTRKPWVKTSLAPGSKVVTDYYDRAGLTADLDAMGFQTVGYGCTTCIGNSGPLPAEVDAAIKEGDLVVSAVLSGNRNFEGRVHPNVKANYLASPPLCVAYAIAGTVGIDLVTEPLGTGSDGKPVFLKEIWPTQAEIQAVKAQAITSEQFQKQYGNVFTGNPTWNSVPVSSSELYPWDAASSYIQSPPYFEGLTVDPKPIQPISRARCLVHVGDSVTTDHISPAGDIADASPAGDYLKSLGVPKSEFNSYGSRRGNDRVMTRGTFANVRVKNKLAVDPTTGKVREGSWTRDLSKSGAGVIRSIYEASLNYQAEKRALIVLAGKDYGMGSSRDWAAKGTLLLGCRAVIAESFERIHRSNLVGMGVLPLCYLSGESAATLGLTGEEEFDIELKMNAKGTLEPRSRVLVTAHRTAGAPITFEVICRIDTPVEAEYYRNGGVLHTVLRRLRRENPPK